MVEIIIPSFYFLCGVCFYVFLFHFFTGIQKPYHRSQLIFACASFSVFLSAGFHILALNAVTIVEFVFALKLGIASGLLAHICLLWFIASYAKKVSQTILLGLTLFGVMIFIVNIVEPYSLQYATITALNRLELPWGESLTKAVGQNSKWFLATLSVLAFYLIYILYVLTCHYFATRKRSDLYMLLAWCVLIIFRTQGILTRLSIIHFPPLGVYGFLGMIIAWSFVLSFEHRRQLNLAKFVYESSSEGIAVLDADNCIAAINPAFTHITGYTSCEAIGQNLNMLKSSRHAPSYYRHMRKEIINSGKWQGEIWSQRKNGVIYPGWLSINTVCNNDGSINLRVAAFSDITKEKKSDELIWKQANFDDLTGLLNRRMVNEILAQEIKKSNRTSLPFAVMLIDLDHFKDVNDSLGHDMGDALLKEASLRMTNAIRDTDFLGRLGGDEFIIVLNEFDRVSSVGRVATELLEKLARPYVLGKELSYISASIGITIYPEDALDAITLIKNADQAMYAAKRQGRNCYHYYTPAMQEAALMRSRLSNDLHTALEYNQFIIYYQPIVALETGAIHKAEALIRWQHPVLGLVSPGDFISVAEDTGQIIEIGDWVFYQAAAELARLRKIYNPEFQISINKSPVQFKSKNDYHIPWFEYLKKLELPGDSIVVEITEGLLMDSKEEISHQLLYFRDQGTQFALDDFGTGYSSLSYLKKFDIDYIKIDKSFVSTLATGSSEMALCEAMVEMAHKLGIKVIAEGVETKLQRDLLRQIQCDYGQGYLFSRPLPIEEFEKLLS